MKLITPQDLNLFEQKVRDCGPSCLMNYLFIFTHYKKKKNKTKNKLAGPRVARG